MKIEIDLNDILHDDQGDAMGSLAQSIRRQVIETITAEIKKDTKRQIKEHVSEQIDAALAEALKESVPSLVQDVVEGSYIPVDAYGRRGEPTTFRDQIINSLQQQMVYKKDSYGSQQNAFTRAVDEIVKGKLDSFKADFQKKVDAEFTQAALEYAREAVMKRLGIKP